MYFYNLIKGSEMKSHDKKKGAVNVSTNVPYAILNDDVRVSDNKVHFQF